MCLKGTPCFGLHEKFMYLIWNEPENHVFKIVHAGLELTIFYKVLSQVA